MYLYKSFVAESMTKELAGSELLLSWAKKEISLSCHRGVIYLLSAVMSIWMTAGREVRNFPFHSCLVMHRDYNAIVIVVGINGHLIVLLFNRATAWQL